MSTSKRTPRSYVPEPRSGEDLVLLPLDPDEVIGEEKPRSRKTYAALAALTLVCVVILAAYLGWNAASPQKSAGRTSEPQPDNREQAGNVPQELDLPVGLAQPAAKLPTQANRSGQPASLPPDSLAGISSKATEMPRVGDRVSGPTAAPAKPADSASWVVRETPKQRADTRQQPQQYTERQSLRITLPPASAEEGGNAVQLRRAKEMIAQLSALISRGDFATAVNSAITFRDKNPGLAKAGGNEYRELLKLQRTATEKYFSSQASSGRRPAYDTGDLDVAVIDHDLMTAYLQAAMPTFAREHFLNAEKGYERALAIARQRERTASGGSSAKRDIQQITENLGLLYTSWAEYKPDVSILRKADAAFYDSERLLDYAEDPVSAKKRVVDGKASIERVRRRLP